MLCEGRDGTRPGRSRVRQQVVVARVVQPGQVVVMAARQLDLDGPDMYEDVLQSAQQDF